MGANSQRRLRRSELHVGISITGRRGGASATRRRPPPAARRDRFAPRSESRASASFPEAVLQTLCCDQRLPLAPCLGARGTEQAWAGALGAGSPSTHQSIRRFAVFSW